MKRLIYFCLLSLFFLPPVLFAQLDQLKNMSPDELKKKATEMGYSEEDYLKFQQLKQQTSEVKEKVDTVGVPKAPTLVTPPAPKAPEEYILPSFQGRDHAASLPAFGYNIFTYSPTTFEPSVNIPAPKNYVVGPGDEIVISLWGATQLVHKLTVAKDGSIYIPDVGLVPVNGLTLSALKARLFERLSKVYSSLNVDVKSQGGTSMDVSTGRLRSVKVYVLGEITKPGGYTLPSLSTAFTVLYYSGGPTLNGSLRKVKILRDGRTVSEIDVYNYLLKGDKSFDVNLEDGDIIFVPPAGKRVAAFGSILRPAIYELKDDETLRDLIKFSGNVTFNTYFQRVHVERIIPFDQRANYTENILNLDVSFNSINSLVTSIYKLEDGDVISFLSINKRPENRVDISGSVRKPGAYELTGSNMTVRDLVVKADSLFPNTFTDEALLIRTLPNEKKEAISFNLKNAMEGDPSDNLVLENRDDIRIYSIENFHPTRNVEILGEVNRPGKYSRYENMTLTDLMVLAGGVTEKAHMENIGISRLDTLNSDIYYKEYTVDLPNNYWEVKPENDFLLEDYDRVYVKIDTAKNFDNKVVALKGEVEFPGSYSLIKRGERLSDLITRANGFKNGAYKEGIYVNRFNSLFEKSEQSLLPDTIRLNLYNRPLLNKKVLSEFSNRIPIDWEAVEKDNNSINNIILQPGDEINVPKDPNIVYVMGEVGMPSNVPYKKGEGLSYYIKNAGGYTTLAAEDKEVVVLPNGKTWSRSGWFFIPDPPILSGSTVFVPTYIEQKSDAWPVIRDIITVVSTSTIVILTVLSLTHRLP
ncbi:MAG: SLBB domain-containing protein [Ignavibacteriaceae bacterium]|nr:SLBB domain-containing protein [Ignavibacteriaceae bacterium]